MGIEKIMHMQEEMIKGYKKQIAGLEYEKYTNVKVVAKEKNSGLSDTRNVGIKESCGQYIMFLDSDDYV